MIRVSSSRLSSWIKCGVAYHYRYETDLKPPTRIAALARGGALASTFGWFFERLLDDDAPPREELVEHAGDTLAAAFVDVDREHPLNRSEAPMEELQSDIRDIIAFWHDEVLPELDVVAQEEAVEVPIPDWDVTIVGRRDLRLADGTLQDTKWRKKKPDVAEVSRSDQLTIYAMPELARARREGDENAVVKVRLDVMQRMKRLGPRIFTITSVRNYDDVQRVLRKVGTFRDAVEKEVYHPADSGAWWCDEGWCEWWDICPYGSAGSRPATIVERTSG